MCKKIGGEKNYFHKKFYLVLGIIFACVILAFFKYFRFFTDGKSGAILLLMPLGLSYYTFKIISFLVDTYKGKRPLAELSLIDYAIYVSFFPQIICGPITRADEILDYLNREMKLNYVQIRAGLYKILSGLFKKIVIADRLSTYVNVIFDHYSSYPAVALWMAAFFYTIQIYCDFAGYSEIVIGITELFGFRCHENFKLPYFSCSIREFWNRWHISLSTWLRDYVYIPLGGNRVCRFRQRINVMVVFLVSGIWHGSGLNFLLWGIWHGILNILSPKKPTKAIWRTVQVTGTFLCAMFGWILFRAESVKAAFGYMGFMFQRFSLDMNSIIASVMPFTGDYSCLAYMLTVCLFILLLFVMEWRDYRECAPNKKYDVHCSFLLSYSLE